jgi:L-rhamnose 1-dehydrogenase
VVCADIDAAAAEATAAQISAAGERAAALDLDVRDRSFVDSTIAATVREFGRLDVLLDCVGVSQTAAFLDIDPGEWERVIAVNLTGMFHLGQQAARQMVRQGAGGSIINVTSQLAEVARPERAAYVASEGRQPVADPRDGARTGAARHPRQCDRAGPTLTGLTRASYADPEKRRATIAQIPLGRMGQPEDIVGAILFLASDESRWVTGGTVTVDGGYLVQ